MIARLVLAGFTAALFAAAPAAHAAAPLFVDAREWSLTLSRATVPAGKVSIQLQNAGEDDHDLRLRRLDRKGRPTGATRSIGATHPGTLAEATFTLSQGRWKLWCSLSGHQAAGMKATLKAR
ncbi:MAG: hypothetical protein JHC95_16745 [Solirubrobacteraceae bacterium]|nr:hypothetical protein [Solirubrobacteraceae bacterium]